MAQLFHILPCIGSFVYYPIALLVPSLCLPALPLSFSLALDCLSLSLSVSSVCVCASMSPCLSFIQTHTVPPASVCCYHRPGICLCHAPNVAPSPEFRNPV
jgi:hypothetical protein